MLSTPCISEIFCSSWLHRHAYLLIWVHHVWGSISIVNKLLVCQWLDNLCFGGASFASPTTSHLLIDQNLVEMDISICSTKCVIFFGKQVKDNLSLGCRRCQYGSIIRMHNYKPDGEKGIISLASLSSGREGHIRESVTVFVYFPHRFAPRNLWLLLPFSANDGSSPIRAHPSSFWH